MNLLRTLAAVAIACDIVVTIVTLGRVHTPVTRIVGLIGRTAGRSRTFVR